MAEIGQPFEHLELQDGQSASFRALRYEQGETIIKPRHAPQGKNVAVLRIHVPADDKPSFPHYWDVTQNGLIAQLGPHLLRSDLGSIRFHVTAYGYAEKKRYRLTVESPSVSA